MKPTREPLEPVLIMLCGMVVFFVTTLFVAEKFFGSDAQLFQVVANLLSGFGGALLMRVKPRSGGEQADPPAGTTSQVTSTTKTTVQEALPVDK